MYREVVQVLVGARGTSFTVHKGLLCSESDFFKAALTGGFSEAREGVVKLADEREDVFEIFITWLYSGKLVVEDEGVDATLTLMEIFRVYVFADAHQPGVGRNGSGQNGEKGGFAGAVGPHNSDFIAPVNTKINISEQRSVAVCFR